VFCDKSLSNRQVEVHDLSFDVVLLRWNVIGKILTASAFIRRHNSGLNVVINLVRVAYLLNVLTLGIFMFVAVVFNRLVIASVT
jgi:hypothetical protein